MCLCELHCLLHCFDRRRGGTRHRAVPCVPKLWLLWATPGPHGTRIKCTRYNLLMAAKVGSRCCAGNTAIMAFEPPGPFPWSCSLRPVKQGLLRAVHECSPQQGTGAISSQPCGCKAGPTGSMGWQLSLITDSTPEAVLR